MNGNRYGQLAALLGAAALALAGCGGGGGSGSGITQDAHDALQMDLDAAVAALAEARGELTTSEADVTRLEGELETSQAQAARLRVELATANGSVDSLTSDLADAEGQVTSLTGELADATASVASLTARIGSADDPTSLQGLLAVERTRVANLTAQLETATGEATVLRGQLTTAQNRATTLAADLAEADAQILTLQGQVTTERGRVTQAEQEAQQAQDEADRRIAEAEAQTAINLRAGPYLRAIVGGGTQRPNVGLTWDRGSNLMINPSGDFASGSGAPGISGFTPSTHVRQVGVTGEQTIFLYRTIQAPGSRPFWEIYGLNVAMNAADASYALRGSSAQHTVDTTNATMYSMLRVSGSLGGAGGTFTCASCTGVIADGFDAHVTFAQGVPTFITAANWVFTPSSISNGMLQMNDPEHVYFGIMAQESFLPDGAHAFQYITGGISTNDAGVRADSALANFADLTGTARFSGGAIGKYVTRNQVGDDATIGTFTAAANFTADFDGNTLEGRITDFRDGGQPLPGNWNVYLGTAANAPAAFAGGTVTDAVASASLGGVTARGDWDATLYGSVNAALADRTMYPLTRYPLADLAGVVGNFNAVSTQSDGTTEHAAAEATAAIAGAFGATPR